MRGSVIEINERLLTHPQLLSDSQQSDGGREIQPSTCAACADAEVAVACGPGYLCVMLPKLQEKRAIGEACQQFDHSVLNVRPARAATSTVPPPRAG